ncbi:MAG: hypothetical protein JSU08_16165 [Acidobacteria bacterium]|nr:hypothetical protein [Acidobacteriota bacterium]
MRRMQLFEWEDQPWLPQVFRDFITDQLRFTHTEPMRRPVNLAIARMIGDLLAKTGRSQVIDLCAGAGGPITEISGVLCDDLRVPAHIVLTDLYPNVAAFRAIERESNGRISARLEGTDATDVPASLPGVRTIFTALHHFPPPLATRVLADAVRKREPIAVFEPLERTARMAFLVGLMSLIRGFTHALRVGHVTAARVVFTYLLPLAPFVFAWDGTVSALRTYTADELLAMATSVTAEGYEWTAGRFDIDGPYGPMPTTYLLGRPM